MHVQNYFKKTIQNDDLCLFLFPHCHSVKTTGIFAIEYQNIVCVVNRKLSDSPVCTLDSESCMRLSVWERNPITQTLLSMTSNVCPECVHGRDDNR